MPNRRAFTHWVKITDAAKGEIICIILNTFAPFAFFAANRTNKGVVQLRFLGLKLVRFRTNFNVAILTTRQEDEEA